MRFGILARVRTAGGMSDDLDDRLARLEASVKELYIAEADDVPFHGWHHIWFVKKKAVEFACERNADERLVAASALVHDLNYIAKRNSEPKAGRRLRDAVLKSTGFDDASSRRIEEIVKEAHTATRTKDISPEGSALSDADTLFKALPMTPVVFSHLYLSENGIGVRELGQKILNEQVPLLASGIYFYDPRVRERYLPWAQANIDLWRKIMECLDDPDVVMLLDAINVRI